MNTNSCEKVKGIPAEIMVANGQDWANHIARYCSCNAQIQAVLEFEKRLDADCMKKAVRLSIDAEPVLGCIFMEDPGQAYWRRLKDIDSIEWCVLEQTQNSEAALERFVTSPLEPELHQLETRIIRSDKSDILCIKINHACSDGGGLKEYLNLLSGIYTHLCKDKSYVPQTNSGGNRDAAKVFEALGITDPRMAFNPQTAALKPTWGFPHHSDKREKLCFAVRRVDKAQLEAMYKYAKEKEATVNDTILTAFYRAMFELVRPEIPEPMEICVSVDLRRYLPDKKAGTVCNLSGVVNARSAMAEGESFEAALGRVSAVMKSLKGGNPGMHSAASMELLRSMSYSDASAVLKKMRQRTVESGKSSPLLSNLGVISQYPFRFGDNAAQDAYIITPAIYSPGFMLGASTYNSVLTLCVSYYEPSIYMDDVERFMDLVYSDIINCNLNCGE